MPISLGDDELRIVMDAAAPIPTRDRDPFLRAVAVGLSRYPEIGAGSRRPRRRQGTAAIFRPVPFTARAGTALLILAAKRKLLALNNKPRVLRGGLNITR
jgi:hypothetical protein